MCGICGMFGQKNQPVDRNVLQRMTDLLVHRGPDEQGQFIDGAAGLGHRRLSIIDLASGQQPMFNEDNSVAIVFNGEIFNYQKLNKKLAAAGHRIRTNSDTETIIHLYEEYGEHCAEYLRGQYAIAIWDKRRQSMFLARDRLGIKPLYYYLKKNLLVFGSEIKSILAHPAVKRELNSAGLDQYFTYLYVRAPETIFKDIYKLEPGHWLMASPDGVKQARYWDLAQYVGSGAKHSEEYYTEKLLDILKQSVQMRLMSEVPLGAFLSGGLDSSAIVGLMTQVAKNSVVTASIGFEEEKFNEIDYARNVAEKFSTEHHEFFVRAKALDILGKLAWHFDEPFADSPAVPTYYVSQTARRCVTVALSGDGGDENFAGYRNYRVDKYENYLRVLPQSIRSILFGTLGRIYPRADFLPQWLRAKTFFKNAGLSHAGAYHNTKSAVGAEYKRELYSADFQQKISGYDPFQRFLEYYNEPENCDELARILYVDIKTYLVDDILTKVDRMSMAHSLEVRVPILDHEFVEFAASIPSNLKLKGRVGKYIFKQSLEKLLPEQNIHRRKMGFSVPLANWFRGELKDIAAEALLGKDFAGRGYFDADYVKTMWEEHQSGYRNYATNLWQLLMFELWHRTFIDRSELSEITI